MPIKRGDLKGPANCFDRLSGGVHSEGMDIVWQSLRELDDPVLPAWHYRAFQFAQCLVDDLGALRNLHSRHVNLADRALNTRVRGNERVHVVPDANKNNSCL